MIVYLDQNKWIELAKIYHGKLSPPGDVAFLKEIKASIECGYKYPLSAIHYMEFSRISNVERRKRLGEVMWKYSKGITLASTKAITIKEIETSLKQFFPNIKPRPFSLICSGIEHTFGESLGKTLPDWLNSFIDEAMLKGHDVFNIEPISHFSTKYRENFRYHLESLHQTKAKLDKSKWENWLYAMAITDIRNPLAIVMKDNDLDKDVFENFSVDQLNKFVDAMPSRSLDLHLHRQVLKNPNYKPKISDLEDWSGLGVAACYCDIVVCEKHFASMLKRDEFKTHARVVTNLYEIFENVA
ncbi:MAG: hypothetical protein JW914_10495 [Syntrophaceae bacterium]|nr:hypothetical protein [Syntrophaceae bacterium]